MQELGSDLQMHEASNMVIIGCAMPSSRLLPGSNSWAANVGNEVRGLTLHIAISVAMPLQALVLFLVFTLSSAHAEVESN